MDVPRTSDGHWDGFTTDDIIIILPNILGIKKKTALEIKILVKMVNVMTWEKFSYVTSSDFLLAIIHILNLLTKLKIFCCSIKSGVF